MVQAWQLNFNVSKCNLLHLGPPHTFGEYTINGSIMVSNGTVRDLGVLVDNRLKFHEQVSTVTKKANRVLAIVHKSFEYTSHLSAWIMEPLLVYTNHSLVQS